MAIKMYYEANSPIHRLDPRVKLLMVVLYIILIFAFSNLWYLMGLAIFALVMAFISRIPSSVTIPLIKAVLMIGVFLFLFLSLSYGGDTVLFTLIPKSVPKIGGFGKFTLEGILAGVSVTLRLFGVMFFGPTLMMTIRTEHLIIALCWFKIPYKYAFIVSGLLTFAPILQNTANDIGEAQKARAFDAIEKGGIIGKVKAYVPRFLPLIIIFFQKAFNLQIAMESRAFGRVFRSGCKRTYLTEMSFRKSDLFVASVSVLFFLGSIGLRFLGVRI